MCTLLFGTNVETYLPDDMELDIIVFSCGMCSLLLSKFIFSLAIEVYIYINFSVSE